MVYRGKPVTEGSLNLFSKEKGVGGVAKIDGSGKFALPQPLEAGTYAVYVTASTEPPPPGSRPKPAQAALPRKARDPNTSGVTVKVERGDNDLVVELTD